MDVSVRTKPQKKQDASVHTALDPDLGRALVALEGVCMRMLESRFSADRRDVERLYWQQRFKNIVTPVSLALAETKGPRQFHHHYRHSDADDSVLTPVLEDPFETLAQVCKEALRHCQQDLVGIEDDSIIDRRDRLEGALRIFLMRWKELQQADA
jgi:hypothetical protein